MLSDRPPAPWWWQAACRADQVDPEWFFPERGEHRKAQRARAVCRRCPVQAPCLADALATPPGQDAGIRAGTSTLERRALRRRGAA